MENNSIEKFFELIISNYRTLNFTKPHQITTFIPDFFNHSNF